MGALEIFERDATQAVAYRVVSNKLNLAHGIQSDNALAAAASLLESAQAALSALGEEGHLGLDEEVGIVHCPSCAAADALREAISRFRGE